MIEVDFAYPYGLLWGRPATYMARYEPIVLTARGGPGPVSPARRPSVSRPGTVGRAGWGTCGSGRPTMEPEHGDLVVKPRAHVSHTHVSHTPSNIIVGQI